MKLILWIMGICWSSVSVAAVLQSDLSLLADGDSSSAVVGEMDLLWHSRVANYGHPDSQFFIAQVYEQGRLVPRDIPKALEFYRKAALQGHLEACLRLAHLLPDEAVTWYEAAARQDDPQSQIKLARIYEERGDTERAVFWLEKAMRFLFPNVPDLTTVSPDLKRLKEHL